jgi:putative addiction module component (TIGR02574 family)
MFDFGTFPTLRTERLDLREFDAGFLADIFAVRSDPVVRLYNSVPHLTRDDTFRFIAEQQTKYSRHTEITWALLARDLGRVVGDVTLFDWDRYHRRALVDRKAAASRYTAGMSDANQVLEAALQLAPRERAELVEALTASLDGSDLGADWENEIRLRVGDVDAGRVKPVPGEEALARIEQRLRGR